MAAYGVAAKETEASRVTGWREGGGGADKNERVQKNYGEGFKRSREITMNETDQPC